jgi:alkanesulfonate monooxygenase SsuD/methylene tetrahydromethanopterin reductase-like flavin-dependent oxidoreductase (luciferase family)
MAGEPTVDSVRLGISPFASTRAGVEQLAGLAVSGGITMLWLGDGLLHNPDFPTWSGAMEPCTELAWLAGRFPQAELGLSAAVLPLRDITWLAKQAMTLDHVTQGRFTLAVAPGFWPAESAARGLDHAERGEHFDDALDGLIAALAGRAHHGPRVMVPAGLSPGAVTVGGPPIWLAGAAATMRRALARGLPFQVSRISPEALAPLAREWRDEGGTTLGVRIRVRATTTADGEESARAGGLDWQALVGSASYLVDAIGRYAELGVSDLSAIPGQDDRSSLSTVQAIVEEVLPVLARETPG